MKKARILLTAITVMAVVGGALAFKPAKFSQRDVYCPIITEDLNKCPLQDKSKTNRNQGTSTFRCTNPQTGQSLGFVYTATTTTIVEEETITTCVTTATTNVVYNTANE